MPNQNLHIEKPVKRKNYSLFLVLIPIFIFVGVLAFFKFNSPSNNAANNLPQITTPLIAKEDPLKSVFVGATEIKVALANTPKLRAIGLSNTESLPSDQGMLFVFGNKNVSSPFWMKDMLIPIDIIWINDGIIIQIDENIPAPPKNAHDSELNLYLPSEPIDYVLEVNSYFVKNHNIKVGNEVNLTQAL